MKTETISEGENGRNKVVNQSVAWGGRRHTAAVKQDAIKGHDRCRSRGREAGRYRRKRFAMAGATSKLNRPAQPQKPDRRKSTHQPMRLVRQNIGAKGAIGTLAGA